MTTYTNIPKTRVPVFRGDPFEETYPEPLQELSYSLNAKGISSVFGFDIDNPYWQVLDNVIVTPTEEGNWDTVSIELRSLGSTAMNLDYVMFPCAEDIILGYAKNLGLLPIDQETLRD